MSKSREESESSLQVTRSEAWESAREPAADIDGASSSVAIPASASVADRDVVSPGHYRIRGEVARGGLGRILEAHDTRLDRPVAIKQPLTQDAVVIARFMREALVTARLQHPAIVPVYEAGRWPSGEPYYAMKLVKGRSLHDAIEERRTLRERLALLPSVIAVADAIAYAHGQGVIHRDLKSSNILIGPFGETVVIDWGLAKDLGHAGHDGAADDDHEREADLTRAGAVVGTPAYMSPEQARGEPVGRATDVYALGALLYRLLVGAPPYEGPNVLAQVRAGAPPSPESREPGIPRELGAIVRKAMARRAEERYPSARELAEDLRRFETGQLVGVYVYSRRARLARWLRRYRAPVAVAAIATALLVVTGLVSVRRIVQERAAAVARSNELILVQAERSLETDPTESIAWLKTYPLDGADWGKVREIALDAMDRGVARHVFWPKDRRMGAFLQPSLDGRLLIGTNVAGRPGAIVALGTEAGNIVSQVDYGMAAYNDSYVAPDGASLFMSFDRHSVDIFNPVAGTLSVVGRVPGAINRVVARCDNSIVALGTDEGDVHVVRNSLINPIVNVIRAPPEVANWSLSHDGKAIAFIFSDGVIRQRNLATSMEREVARISGAMSPELSYSPDGRRLTVWDQAQGGRLSIVDVATGRKILTEAVTEPMDFPVFSPDGRFVALPGEDRRALWDLDSGVSITLLGHPAAINRIAFCPDRRELASASEDGLIIRRQPDGSAAATLKGHQGGYVGSLLYSSDCRHIVSNAADAVRLWQIGEIPRQSSPCNGIAKSPTFSPDGRFVAATCDTDVQLWDVREGRLRVLHGPRRLVLSVVFSPDGRMLASSGQDGLRLWSIQDDVVRVIASFPDPRNLKTPIWLQHGAMLAASDNDRVCVWSTSDGALRDFREPGRAVHVAGVPGGSRLAWTADDDEVRLWAAGTESVKRLHVGSGVAITRVALSPDERRLASIDANGVVRVHDPSTGASRVVGGHAGAAIVLFTRDGLRVLTGGEAGDLGIWSVNGGDHELVPAHHGAIMAMRLAPDGSRLVTAGEDPFVRIWKLSPLRLDWTYHMEHPVYFHVDISPDGTRIVTSLGDKPGVHLRRIPPSPFGNDTPAAVREALNQLTTAELVGTERRLMTPER